MPRPKADRKYSERMLEKERQQTLFASQMADQEMMSKAERLKLVELNKTKKSVPPTPVAPRTPAVKLQRATSFVRGAPVVEL